MTCCPQCTGWWAYEHLTNDERIVYCANCGWEHREMRARPTPAPAAARRVPTKPPRRS